MRALGFTFARTRSLDAAVNARAAVMASVLTAETVSLYAFNEACLLEAAAAYARVPVKHIKAGGAATNSMSRAITAFAKAMGQQRA